MIEIKQKVKEFVIHENELLDNNKFNEWYDLFSDDGVYWVPGSRDQTDPVNQMSIALENKLLLKLRIERLSHHRAFSLQPSVYSLRVVQEAKLCSTEPNDNGCMVVETNVMYSEFQKPNLHIYPAKVTYQLRPKDASWEIVEKRVDLLNVDGYLPGIQLFI